MLLDLDTPAGDGRNALRQIREDHGLRTISTVVLSTSANPRNVDFCYAHHVNAYHAKLVSPTAHLKVLQDIFSYWLACALPLIERTPGKQ